MNELKYVFGNKLMDTFEEPKGWPSKLLTFPYPLMYFSSYSLILYNCQSWKNYSVI